MLASVAVHCERTVDPGAAVFFATSMLRTLVLVLLASLSLPLAAQTQTPHLGAPFTVPAQGAVVIEAENFDDGGQDVAYHDNTPTSNAGGQYRTGEGVDIITSTDSAGGNFVVNNFDTGEWMEYSVDVQAVGQYEIAIRASSNWTSTPRFHVEIDGANVTGSVDVQLTGSWNSFAWTAKSGVSLPAGQHVLRLVSDAQYFNINQIRITATPSTPFAGVIALPNTFEAENFDNGGEGIAYHDITSTNDGGAAFRTDQGVDIKPDADGAGSLVVNNFQTGEWLVYSVSVATSGIYDIDLRAATGTFTNTAYHIEIDGANVTGSVVLPSTGDFGTFQWMGKRTVQLAAGNHVLKLVSDQQYVDVNQIRVTAVTHTPFTGTPIQLPATFEAENFDNGGEGNAYHDNVAGNAGTEYRPSEDVDIIVTRDTDGGGYSVENFETGEWLLYTVNVAQSGNYDIDLRLASGSFTGAFRVEIDDQNVTGTVSVPPTGSFGTYAWVGKKSVALTQGTHVLKLVSEQQYFDVNQIRVVASTAPPPNPAALLFRSGFEGISLGPITSCQSSGVSCSQQFSTNPDSETGFTWPPQIPGMASAGTEFKLRAGNGANVTAANVSQFIQNDVVPVPGHKQGATTQAQWSRINQNCLRNLNPGTSGTCSTQDTYMTESWTEPTTDLYISFWRKLQPDLMNKFGQTQNWTTVFEWKTTGDLRLNVQVATWGFPGAPYFSITLDNNAGGQPAVPPNVDPYWRCPYFYDPNGSFVLDPKCNVGKVQAPAFGSWFKFELFWHRSTGSDGRVWMAVNGVPIVDRAGQNRITDSINRIMYMQLYSDLPLPLEQWTDDVQVWTKIPVGGVDAKPGDPWYDPPYGMHVP